MTLQVVTSLAGALYIRGDGVWLRGSVDLRRGKRGSTYSFELADPALELANTLPVPTRNARVPVEVWAGPVGARPPKLFSGWVSRMAPSYSPGRLKVTAVDKGKRLRKARRSRQLKDVSLEDLAAQFAGDEGLTLDTSRADGSAIRSYGSVLQHSESDWELLVRLCGAVGHTVLADGDALRVVDEGAALAAGDSVVGLRLGDNVLGDVEFDISERRARSTSRITDYSGNLLVDADGDAVDRTSLYGRTGISLGGADAPQFTDQAVEFARRAQRRGRKVFETSMMTDRLELGARPTGVATLAGFGPRFDGLWFIERAEHDLGALRTTVEIYNEGAD